VSDTLDLLVGGGKGVPEKLLLIERPTADGRALNQELKVVRQWLAPGT
jgi:hypothetical protein